MNKDQGGVVKHITTVSSFSRTRTPFTLFSTLVIIYTYLSVGYTLAQRSYYMYGKAIPYGRLAIEAYHDSTRPADRSAIAATRAAWTVATTSETGAVMGEV